MNVNLIETVSVSYNVQPTPRRHRQYQIFSHLRNVSYSVARKPIKRQFSANISVVYFMFKAELVLHDDNPVPPGILNL